MKGILKFSTYSVPSAFYWLFNERLCAHVFEQREFISDPDDCESGLSNSPTITGSEANLSQDWTTIQADGPWGVFPQPCYDRLDFMGVGY